jgi:hypothetical protein
LSNHFYQNLRKGSRKSRDLRKNKFGRISQLDGTSNGDFSNFKPIGVVGGDDGDRHDSIYDFDFQNVNDELVQNDEIEKGQIDLDDIQVTDIVLSGNEE